ncbi:hypothetical protein BDQ94DRAFT_152770 [Aspergillus welwitschiae]|uniref:Uncharacterized protein n=1 Tax=Aspergillus welwitschiae TaxID=1341132 RepID=A0A3F3PMN0_9EURO|nr:hypothetical protein BDQ94DRAFT_152770 [Aspergillus welwitschiae]RDH28205.1 hypothetical protein BDQ94DRAFT_152770 [Aspergillus welwitschiae]
MTEWQATRRTSSEARPVTQKVLVSPWCACGFLGVRSEKMPWQREVPRHAEAEKMPMTVGVLGEAGLCQTHRSRCFPGGF